ncbi:MAG TPA: hypothetical protein VFX04_08270 [Rhodanobacteraceae bacterium]|jgi:hypothetical protein|nr:hypothetical protein [Rhodanobacteraceae bacterium]
MQGKHDMTLDSEKMTPAAARNTAAGLEAWLSGVHDDASLADDDAPAMQHALPDAGQAPEEVGPVNAAEALALGTFSTARKLVGTDGAELVVDPEQDTYHFESTSLKPLAALLQQRASAWTPIYSEALKTARAASTAQPLERLRWYAGLIATPGILGRELNRDDRYKLSRWPETEREFPRYFRVATAMSKQPATPDEIAAASGTPYEEVVDYINASHASGRLETTSTRKSADAVPATSRRERLIARLNKPLFVR